MQYMDARELIRRRVQIAENAFADIIVWQLPQSVPGSEHLFKYRLAFVVDSVCVMRYDNETGKGDHRHDGDVEEPYAFISPSRLMADFFNDIVRWKHEHGYP